VLYHLSYAPLLKAGLRALQCPVNRRFPPVS
jgi:hypothetical protein